MTAGVRRGPTFAAGGASAAYRPTPEAETMHAILDSVRGMDPKTVLIGMIGVAMLVAYIARWWWTAPVVRALARVEAAVRSRS